MTIDKFETAKANAKKALDIEKGRGEEANDRFQLMCAAFIDLAQGLEDELTAIHDRLEQIEDALRNE
ncbi:hypothetical protein KDX27_30300 [Burkholderia cenocepacia]|uniref:hypothetical protein n=1 Tax=Burkholderia cenocepacia TaxID=95486 RepID=UPI001B924EB1|nr:hypothetical protein [Burkholderia cenocepacia]MBR8028897.1 hypothetical protein [Burkholderia cenocepacia]MBR8172025.1 hypothetical protein [Burkholderia cenocepacia]